MPLITVRGLDNDNKNKHGGFYTALLSWASHITDKQLGHVMIITSDASLEDDSARGMRTPVVVETISLNDAEPQAVKQFVLKNAALWGGGGLEQLGEQELELSTLRILGGRYSDVSRLLKNIHNGFSPSEAVERIISNTDLGVRGFMFGQKSTLFPPLPDNVKVDKVLLWRVVSAVVESPSRSVPYDRVLFSIFQGDETSLRALVRVNFFKVQKVQGGERELTAGSPVILEVFRRLCTNDVRFKAGMDLLVAKALEAKENAKILEYEAEMMNLSTAMHNTWNTLLANDGKKYQARLSYLLELIQESQAKCAGFNGARLKCEATLKATNL
jgi:hypothetical protein